MFDDQKSYSSYLVIFIDILGSQSRTDFQELYQINRIFHEEFEKNQKKDMEHTVYFRKIYTFSDCAYIFYGFKDEVEDERKDLGKLFTVALCNCEYIFWRFLRERIIFRGGISYGGAYIDSNRSMFFGPAVNRAYKLESEIAIHPRIVIDREVAEKVLENIEQVKYKLLIDPQYIQYVVKNLAPKMLETGDGIVEIDEDENYIFNYLHLPENCINCGDIYLDSQDFLEDLKQYCYKQIEDAKQYKVIDKYCYLLRFIRRKQ